MSMLDTVIEQLQRGENIEGIYLGNAKIGDDGVRRLAQALLSGKVSMLTTICLSNNSITDTGVEALIPTLKKCKALKCLTLDGNSIKECRR